MRAASEIRLPQVLLFADFHLEGARSTSLIQWATTLYLLAHSWRKRHPHLITTCFDRRTSCFRGWFNVQLSFASGVVLQCHVSIRRPNLFSTQACTTRDCGVLVGGNVIAIAPKLSKSSFGNSTTEPTTTTLRHTTTSIIELFTIAPSDPAKKFHPLHPLHLTNFTYMTGEPLRNGKGT